MKIIVDFMLKSAGVKPTNVEGYSTGRLITLTECLS